MNWQESEHIKENKYDISGSWLNIEYFEALNILFRIENALRIFVYIILKKNLHDKWLNLSITSDDDEKSTIASISKRRKAQDDNFAYLGFSLNSPLLHLTSGELIRIIYSDSYWKYFKEYFLGSKDIMKNKLDEIGNVRNSLAHFRPIKKGDIELVKQNSIHALSLIEDTLQDFFSCIDIVPTNTPDEWYNTLKGLNSEYCSITFNQSKDEKWVKITLKFKCEPLHTKKHPYYRIVNSLTLKANSILELYSNISKYVISVTENYPNISGGEEIFTQCKKNLEFTLDRETLDKHNKDINDDFLKILTHIDSEISLIKDDNLARGRLIELVSIGYDKDEDQDYYTLDRIYDENRIENSASVEYWGSFNHSYGNFVTNTERYPWMPIPVSNDKSELPF